MKKRKIGIIGFRGQAARIRTILKKNDKVEINKILYHKKLKIKNSIITQNFNDLLNLDAIIIASPTYTHLEYLKKLKNYKGYILIEKPVINNLSQYKVINKLYRNKKSKVMINYNFNYSKIFFTLKKILKQNKYGKPIKAFISTNHGLAFKKNNGWRFNSKLCKGVGEMVSCHFIKFASTLFGDIKKFYKIESNFSKKTKRNNFDTINLNMLTKKGVIVNIFNSYSTPFINYIKIFLTNGLIIYDGKEMLIHHPRDTFDKKKRFKSPPIIDKYKMPFDKIWNESLNESLNVFIKTVYKGKKFSKYEFESSLKAALPIIK